MTLSETASTGDSTTGSSTFSTAGPSPTSPVSKHGSKAFVDDPPAAASASSLAFSSASAFASASAFTGLSAFMGPFSTLSATSAA